MPKELSHVLHKNGTTTTMDDRVKFVVVVIVVILRLLLLLFNPTTVLVIVSVQHNDRLEKWHLSLAITTISTADHGSVLRRLWEPEQSYQATSSRQNPRDPKQGSQRLRAVRHHDLSHKAAHNISKAVTTTNPHSAALVVSRAND
jgi:hypothetical protein